jgi:hypothetical protein
MKTILYTFRVNAFYEKQQREYIFTKTGFKFLWTMVVLDDHTERPSIEEENTIILSSTTICWISI